MTTRLLVNWLTHYLFYKLILRRLVGEHCDKKGVSKLAPDVLRLMAKTFANEVRVIDASTPL